MAHRGDDRDRYRDDVDLEVRRGGHSRSRSRSPRPRKMTRAEKWNMPDLGPHGEVLMGRGDCKPSGQQRYPWQDEETLRSLHCKDCNVTLNDRDSMMGHLRGTQHLMQLRRLKDHEVRSKTGRSLNDVLVPNHQDYDWNKERGDRKLRPDQQRFLDTKRLDSVPAKFDAKSYDNGQYRYDEKELHCEECDVWVRSRDQMQAHKEGANHKKKSAKVQRFRCELCLIEVPCQDTLNNHMRGKDHIKRVKQLEEQRRKRGVGDEEAFEGGYKTGPVEMAKLSNDEREELKQLRLKCSVLEKKVAEYQKERQKCVREHGKDYEELKKAKQFCLENHIRPKELAKRGIQAHVKKEERLDDLDQASTSSGRSPRVKEEPRAGVKKEAGHGGEYVEENEDDDIIVL